MTWFWTVVGATLVQFVLAELFGWFPALARSLVRRSVRRLPMQCHERYEAEWLAEFEAVPGHGLSKLVWAVQLRLTAGRTAEALGRRHRESDGDPATEPDRVTVAAPATHLRLTARENQVARMASTGMSNREIAEDLFVTVKTVEWHLKHVYEKLGVRSKRDLNSALR